MDKQQLATTSLSLSAGVASALLIYYVQQYLNNSQNRKSSTNIVSYQTKQSELNENQKKKNEKIDKDDKDLQGEVKELIKLNKSTYKAYSAFGPTKLIQNAKRWLRAGPRYHNYFDSQHVKAMIVTCDGLCPGLNVVVREIVQHLHFNYKCSQIYGAKYGFKGIYGEEWIKLSPEIVKTIHHKGGSYLGTSRKGFNKEKIINTLVKHGFNQLYVICSGGSMACVLELYYEIRQRKLNIAICNIPRSIDNDIPLIDESFGFNSAVEEAQRIIESAWTESRSHKNGVGLVRLMGKKCGFIAMGACTASRCSNICLVPEFDYNLYGENGLLQYINEYVRNKGHCLIAFSEGVNNSFSDLEEHHEDIGKFLNLEITKYCNEQQTDVTVKYFDPLYMIRAIKANAYDVKLCSTISQNAVHGLMAGFTGFCIGHVHNKTCFIPLESMLSGNYRNKITPNDKNWQRLLASTGQPSFQNEEIIIQ